MLRSLLLVSTGLTLAASPTLARTWHIAPDGTGDAPTIQAGIDSAAVGDTVEVASGTFSEHDLAPAEVDPVLWTAWRLSQGGPSLYDHATLRRRYIFIRVLSRSAERGRSRL